MRGTLFMWLLFVLAPLVTLALIFRGVWRAHRERTRLLGITLTTASALLTWAAASYIALLLCFEVAWALAHARPAPTGLFPEGATIYVFLAGYASLGATLIIALARIPKRK